MAEGAGLATSADLTNYSRDLVIFCIISQLLCKRELASSSLQNLTSHWDFILLNWIKLPKNCVLSVHHLAYISSICISRWALPIAQMYFNLLCIHSFKTSQKWNVSLMILDFFLLKLLSITCLFLAKFSSGWKRVGSQ